MTSARRRPEDTAEGCRLLAEDDQERAAAMINPHMRASLERSARAWSARARLLESLETGFRQRVAASVGSVACASASHARRVASVRLSWACRKSLSARYARRCASASTNRASSSSFRRMVSAGSGRKMNLAMTTLPRVRCANRRVSDSGCRERRPSVTSR